jgi:hypothetical protein
VSELITINVGATPRGQGASGALKIGVQSIRGSFAWGGSPGTATIVWVNDNEPNVAGQLVEIQLGLHWFAGICKSDTANQSSRGSLREMQFVDLREFLSWDYVYCAFNMPIRRFVNGVWKKRYWHIYPADFNTYTKTFTDAPLAAWQIVAALFSAPTVGSPWSYNLTGNGLFPGGLMNQPVFSFDCLNGVRLDAALNDISERGGLVYTHDPQPGNDYRLVWMRKGYGLLPILPGGFAGYSFPANSDERRLGVSLSGNATNIRVIGERNQYLVLNVPLTADWNTAWEQFLSADLLTLDIFQNEKNPVTGIAYTSYANDPEQWIGGQDAASRADLLTVGQYVGLRNARAAQDGQQFADFKKFEGRSRMDMPAKLYIEKLLWRAYVPNVLSITNFAGVKIGLDSVNIMDSMPCRVTYDPLSGNMQGDPTTLCDGNGVGIVQGVAFGQDLFALVKPERVNAAFTSVNNRPWSQVPFQIDDSGEGQRFIIFDLPCFTSENFLVTINGLQVLNAYPTLAHAAAQAALTFELEPYSYWQGTYPNVSRDRAEYVSGLCKELVGTAGKYQEILFANGASADYQAAIIATNLLLCQYVYAQGGYKLIQQFTPLGTPLGSIIDRVDVNFDPAGFIEVVDLTTERERAHFEPERDLDRKSQQNSLFSGQAQLQEDSRNAQKFAAGIKGMTRDQLELFIRFMNGQFDDTMTTTKLDPTDIVGIPAGDTIDAGTPFFSPPVNATTSPPSNTLAAYPPNYDPTFHTVFSGVTVRDGELANPNKPFWLKTSGETYARVQGPVAENTSVGAAPNYTDYSSTGAYLIASSSSPSVGVTMQAIADSSIKLIKVNLGASSSGGGGNVWL